MSDNKPRRPVREPVGAETAVSADPIGAAIPPIVAPEPDGPATAAPAETVTAPVALAAAAIEAIPQPADLAAAQGRAEAAAEDAWTAFAEAQAALARGFEQAAVALNGMTRSGIAATADAALALFGAKTFAEAVEINAGLARRSVDAAVEGSATLSEIGIRTAAEVSRPVFNRLSGAWSGIAA